MKYKVRCYNIVPAVSMPIIDIRTMNDVDAFMRGVLRPSEMPSSVTVYIDDSISPIDDTEIFEATARRDLEQALDMKVKTFNFTVGGMVDEG